ncbi:Ig-like domain-containing protein [Paraburkholderia adhaesiva]|uniref:Ig-like domain-containing protein n=1 Tax=Paraburkholderia adhaesiva TaxID=2883244 RepID=UPI001F2296EE|nr:Ig-like domain-containing protein [Paraburkholderia adhaesiva]
MSSKKMTLVSNSNGHANATSVEAGGRWPVKVKVHHGVKYLLVDENGQVAPEDVTLTRVGEDLCVTMEGQSTPSLVLEGYFSPSEAPAGLYGIAEDGQLYAYAPTNGASGIAALADGGNMPVALGGDSLGAGAPYIANAESDKGVSFLPLFLLGAGAIGGIVGEVTSHDSKPAPAPVATVEDKPTVEVIDNVGPKQGVLASGDVTDDSTPTFTGTGKAGDTVTIYDGGYAIGTATVGDDGTWTFVPSEALSDGAHNLTVTQTGPGTLVSDSTASITITVDTVAPDTPSLGNGLGAVIDNVGPITGPIAANGVTDDPRPVFQGQGTPGDTITIYDNGAALGTAAVGDDGTWSFQPSSDLNEGSHAITVTESDPAGNESAPSDAFNFGSDYTAPDTPSLGNGLGAVIDNVGPITGPIAANGVTDDPRPVFQGKGTPGDTITVYDNGAALGTAAVGDDGTWSFQPSSDMNEGSHAITITESDPAGNESAPSDAFNFGSDFTPPDYSKLSIGGVYDAVGQVQGNVAQGGSTDDSRPVISGTGTAGDTIIVSVTDVTGTHEVGTATVDANGNWSLEPSTPLVSGNNEFTAVEQDPAGNQTQPSTPYAVVLDFVPPNPPTIETVLDDVGTKTGFLQKGDVTDDSQPTVSGTAQAGSTVNLYDGSTLIGSTTADATGNWAITPDVALKDGTHNLTATATNAIGEVSDATGVWSFTVDTTAPAGVTNQVALDDVGAKQGALASGDSTDDSTPTLSGQAEPGSTVSVYDNGTLIGTAPVDASGNWSYTPGTPLVDGNHALTTTVTDAAGNSSAMSNPPLNLTVDTSNVAVQITSVYDDVGSIQGNLTQGGVTDDTRPSINGTGKAGSTVTVSDGSTVLGTATVDGTGKWTYTPTGDLGQDTHSITATATDAAGNVSDATSAFTFSIDTVAPSAPVVGSVTDDVGAVQGALANGAVTDDPTPTLAGTAEAGSTVSVYDNGKLLGTVTADATGNWSYTPTTPLAEGAHSFTTTATDTAGNTGTASSPFTVTTDYTPPDASMLKITGVYDDVGLVQGNVVQGDTTDDSRPVISGTGTAGDTIIVSVKDSAGTTTHEVGRTTVGADGTWSLEPTTALASGENTFTAVEQDAAGNQTNPSTGYMISLDSGKPNPPVIGNVLDDVGAKTGFLQKGDVTDDSQPTVSGTAQAGSTVNLYDGSTLIGSATADASGNWTITPATALTDGTHSLTATATNAVGVVSDATGAWNFVVDTTAPAGVTNQVALDDVGAKQGALASGDSTDDSTPTLSGQAEPGSTVSVYDNGTLIGTAPVDASGNWSYTPGTPLVDGNHALTTTVTDAAGNSSAMSNPPLNLTVDTSNVTVAINTLMDDVGSVTGTIQLNGVTDDTRPTINGSGKAGSTITVYDGATVLGTTTANSAGSWTFTPTGNLGDGTHSITATATDAAGNVSDATSAFTFSIDTVAPVAPVIGSVTDDVGAVQGALANGAVTDDPTPTLAGTAEAGSTVSVYDNGKLLGTTTADATGNWSYTPTTPLAEGAHSFTTTATDTAGNTGPASTPFTVTTDYTPPDASMLKITGVHDGVGLVQGNVAQGDTTDDSRPVISGTGTAGDTIIVSVKDSAGTTTHEVGRTTVGADGTWSLEPTTALASGENTFTAVEQDAAGNQTNPSTGYMISLDSGKPNPPVIGNVLDDVGAKTGFLQKGDVTDDSQPTVSGTAQAGSTVNLYDGSTLIGSATADASGNWTITPATALTDGTHSLTATATNAVGVVSDATGAWNFVVDTTAPAGVTNQVALDDVGAKQGALASGDSTDDSTPTLSGQAEPGSTVSVYDNGTLIGTAPVDASGNWSYTPGTPLVDGNHALTTTVTDAAGNSSAMSNPPLNLTVDTSNVTVAINTLMDDVGSVTGTIQLNGVTDDTRPTINGSGKAGSTITVYDGATVLGTTTANSAGSWTFTPTGNLGDGTHSITATATDAAGNVSDATSAFTFSIDTVAPSAPVVGSVTDDVGAVQGALANGAVTDDPTPTLAGTAEAGSTVSVYDNGKLLGTVTADATGTWSYTPTTSLSEGAHSFTTTATDAAGNTGPASTPFTVTTDYTAPTATVTIDSITDDNGPSAHDFITNDNTLVFRGSLSAPLATGESVQISLDGGHTWQAASSSVTSWTYDNTSNMLTDGTYDVQVRVADTAGNIGSTVEQSVVVSTATPTQTVAIDTYYDDVGSQQGSFGSGTTTDDRTPLLQGHTQALSNGQQIYVYDGSTLLGAATVDSATNQWTYQLDGLQTDTTHTYTARVADAAGNLGAVSNSLEFSVALNVTVTSETTLDTTPIITGATSFALMPGEYMQVTVNGVTYSSQDGAVVIDPLNNTWYVQVPDANALGQGVYDVASVIKDAGGNTVVSDHTTGELTIAAAPAAPAVPSAGDPNQKATAVTLSDEGQWRILSNQVILDSTATDSSTLGAFSATKLVSNSGTGYAANNYVQNATFIDYNRDGQMDIFSVDSNYDDGQQMFYFNGTTYTAYQVGAFTYAPQTGDFAGNANTANSANTWSWYGGVIAIDKGGDGYVDVVNGDQTPNDSAIRGGYGSQIVLNNNGTVAGMTKDGTFADTYATDASHQPIGGVTQSQPDQELSGVDLNNDGMVDIVMHSTNIVAPNGSVITANGANSTNNSRLVVVSQTADDSWAVTQIVNNVFQMGGGDVDPGVGNGVSMTWADFNGDGYMDLFLGRGNESTTTESQASGNAGEYASRIYFNDGTGKLVFDDPNNDGIGNPTANGMYTFTDNLAGGASLAVDWNHDGKMDVIETPGMAGASTAAGGISTAAQTGPVNLYTNTTENGVVSFTTNALIASIGSNSDPVTGALAIDMDWDGAKDLLVFTLQGNTQYIHNDNVVADGTSLHLRILDTDGINSFYGNTVQLFDSTGHLVGTQIINPQSGNQTNDSTAIVDFYGLDANQTYSAVLLNSVNGVSADVGGAENLGGNTIENVNVAWTDLAPAAANHAYVLTAQAGDTASNATTGNGIVGTGYNDTFFATAGAAAYDGGGGTTTVSGVESWSNTGGMDIVDYKLAGSTALSIDLSLTTAQNTGFNTATFVNIEGIAGGSGNDRFIDGSGAYEQFEGRGGNDYFDLVHGGHDTLLYKVLDNSNATGGNGADTVDHFMVGTWEATANADRIDLKDLLIGYQEGAGAKYINGVATIDASDNIGDYLQVTHNNGNTIVSIDRDGHGGAFSSTALVVLNGVETDLQTLLANHQIVV